MFPHNFMFVGFDILVLITDATSVECFIIKPENEKH